VISFVLGRLESEKALVFSGVFARIPYSTEQGILKCGQGIILLEQGISVEQQGRFIRQAIRGNRVSLYLTRIPLTAKSLEICGSPP
jgi:hypothetical protein